MRRSTILQRCQTLSNQHKVFARRGRLARQRPGSAPVSAWGPTAEIDAGNYAPLESQTWITTGTSMSASSQLRTIRLLHTIIWAILATCILAIPAFGWVGMYRQVLWLSAIVFLEILVLTMNGWQCPLTSVAARCTDDRRDNFDIYLPEWLARHNKVIFGSLFVAGEVAVLVRWRGWIG